MPNWVPRESKLSPGEAATSSQSGHMDNPDDIRDAPDLDSSDATTDHAILDCTLPEQRSGLYVYT